MSTQRFGRELYTILAGLHKQGAGAESGLIEGFEYDRTGIDEIIEDVLVSSPIPKNLPDTTNHLFIRNFLALIKTIDSQRFPECFDITFRKTSAACGTVVTSINPKEFRHLIARFAREALEFTGKTHA